MSKSGRRFGFVSVLLVMGLLLAACGGSQPAAKPAEAPKAAAPAAQPAAKPAEAPKAAAPAAPAQAKGKVPNFISIGTAPAGASFYPLGIAMAEAIKEKVGINASAQVTGASIENINLIVKGQAELGFAMADTAVQAVNGEADFKDKAVKNLRVILAGHTLPYTLVARMDSGIKVFSDIKGKRVAANMPRAAGNRQTMLAALEANGLKWEDVKFQDINNLEESVGKVKDGSLDAIWYPIAAGSAVFIDLNKSVKTNWVSMDQKTIDFVTNKYPFLVRATVAKGATQGQEQEVQSFGAQALIVTAAEIDEEVMYKITKSIIEANDKLVKAHNAGRAYTLQNGPAVAKGLPYHPGAIKYYKEKGVWKN